MNLKKILTSTFSMMIALMMSININAESLSSDKAIIEEGITEDLNVISRVATKEEIDEKELPTKSTKDIQVEKFSVYNDGKVTGNISIKNQNNDLEVNNIDLEGTLLKDPNTDEQILGRMNVSNSNYDIVHFSICKPGKKSYATGNIYDYPTMNIYIKDNKTGNIDFFEFEIKEIIFSEVYKLKENLETAAIEEAYWFVNVIEPEHEVTQEEGPSSRSARIRSIVGYSTLTWSYKDGMGGTFNVKSQFKLNLTIDQSADSVFGNVRVMSFTHTENGKPLKYHGTYGLTRIKGKWGSNHKINRLMSVGTNGNFSEKKPPIYINVSASKQIAPGVTIGLQPTYSSNPVKGYPFIVDGYQAAFEAKDKQKIKYFQMQERNDQLDSQILLYSKYAGKNVSYQVEFTHKHGVYSKKGSIRAHATLRTASQTN